MKTKTIKLYSFDELSEEAQERALNNHKESVYSDPLSLKCMETMKFS